MLYLTCTHNTGNVIVIELQDDTLLADLVIRLVDKGYTSIVIKGWAAEK